MIANWHKEVKILLATQAMVDLKSFLRQQKQAKKIIFPDSKNWFRAFEITPFDKVKVVIIGQDPYHQPGQAHGLSFSVANGVEIPPSLKNIYQELHADLSIPPSSSGDLSHWAEQGVLLLNSVLTVEKNTPGAHVKMGWEVFTDGIISLLNSEKQNLVFLLWGAYAHKKNALINQNKHLVLTSAHPSPLSANKGFFGCRHFSKTNAYLQKHKQTKINW